MIVHDCLLCQTALRRVPSWQELFEKFPTTICERCQQSFERVENDTAVVASANLEQPSTITTLQMPAVSHTLTTKSLYYYNEPMQDYLHRYKFMHDTVLALVFRKQIHEALKNKTVVPIPMHPAKKKQRTFSHIELLLKAAHIPYIDLLEKKSQESQGTKSREERLATPQLFLLKQQPKFDKIILFDDIVTTGTTLNHAKNLLQEAGVQQIQCITLITAKI